jgi:AcrR family transcriptional regulator
MDPAKWESILAEAARAFARYGFRKTSIDDIARAAGVAKGTVYLGCSSKIDLFYQAILRDLRLWNASLARLVDPRASADELLLRLSAEALESIERHPLARGLVLNEYAADLPDFVERLDELRAHGLSTVLDILRIGVRQGRFRGDLDLEAVAQVFLDLMTATIMFHSRGEDAPARLIRHSAAVLDVVLRGLLPRPDGGAADAPAAPPQVES